MNWRATFLPAAILVLFLSLSALGSDITTVPTEDINASFTSPTLVEKIRPERVFYTPSREIVGYVTLELTVDEEGSVESARVLYKTSRLAINNAVDAVSEWKFDPARLNGTPVKSMVSYSLPFGRDLEILEDTSYKEKVLLDDTMLAFLSR